jgi:hypothetical protein
MARPSIATGRSGKGFATLSSLRIHQVAALLILGCAGAAGCGSGRTIASGPDPTGMMAVQQIFTRSCALADCHSSSAPQLEQDLSSVERSRVSIVNVASMEVPDLIRVKPGDSAHSFLFEKISQDNPREGTRMPKGGAPLSNEEIKLIRDWIDGGALP